MKNRHHRSYSSKIIPNNLYNLLNSNTIKGSSVPKSNEKEQILFNHKCSLDVLLDMIKRFQNDYLSKVNDKNKLKISKEMLTLLNDTLSLMKTEKMKKYNYLETNNKNNKKKLQEILFLSENQNKKNNSILYMEKLNTTNIQKKNELKLINFQIENDIQKTDFLIEQNHQIYLYTKSIPFYLETNQEIFCNNNLENIEHISNLLKTMIRTVRDKFISVVKEKMKIEFEINAVSFQIKSIKDNINNNELNNKNKKYIDTEEIIYEETKENNKTIITNQSKRNSYASLNKVNLKNKDIGSISSKNIIKRRLSIDAIMKDNIYPNNIFSLFNKSKEFLNENKNQINNYLNMNINVNVNINSNGFTKYNYTTSSLDEPDDYKSNNYEEQFEFELDENNKIIVSPINSEENINNDNEIFYTGNNIGSNNHKNELDNK